MRGQAGDIPPDGPVDLEELERNLPPLLPQVGYILLDLLSSNRYFYTILDLEELERNLPPILPQVYIYS